LFTGVVISVDFTCVAFKSPLAFIVVMQFFIASLLISARRFNRSQSEPVNRLQRKPTTHVKKTALPADDEEEDESEGSNEEGQAGDKHVK
jgi:hypothetical protein